MSKYSQTLVRSLINRCLLHLGGHIYSSCSAFDSINNLGYRIRGQLASLPGEDIIAVTNSTVEVIAKVTDIAYGSNVTGSNVNYIMDYGGSNVSIGTAISGGDGNATLVGP